MQNRSYRQCRRLRWNTESVVIVLTFIGCAVGAGFSRSEGATTSRVSVSSSGVEGDAASSRASVSADGRYVAFYSDAGTLVAGDVPTFDPNTCPACTGVRDVFVRDRLNGVTVRVSVNSSGVAGNQKSDRPSISSTGRFVAFTSDSDNLVLNDLNGVRDIFVHDRDTDLNGVFDETGGIATSRVSVSSAGLESDGRSNLPAISGDGRYVAFRSRATNLAPGATSGVDHILVHDRQTGATILVSVSSTGAAGNADSDRPTVSPDGRFVAFHSDADNLVPGDVPTFDPVLCPACTGVQDIFVRDRDPDANGVFDEGNATTERVSISSAGVAGNGASSRPQLSSDGRYVLFKSFANNLVSGDTNNADDVFVRDRLSSTTQRVSINSNGDQTAASGPDSGRASVSADGRHIAFYSGADDLVAGDINLVDDVFVRDRNTSTTVRVSVGPGGVQGNAESNRPSISGDGRFVAFYSDAFNLVVGDGPPFDPVLCPACTGVRDIFVRDRDPNLNGVFDEADAVTERVSVSSAGVAANAKCTRPSISADGRYVAFRSTADNLVLNDTNGLQDIFVRDRLSGTTVRVSVSSTGVQTLDGNSDLPSVSGDGRYVAFWSKAGNLVPGDDPPYDPILCPACIGVADIFVRDRDPDANGIFDEGNGTTTRVSVSSAGIAGDAASDRPWMAADGRYVGFISDATNLVAGDTNGHSDVFVHDLQTGTTFRASIATGGAEGNFGSDRITLSADGRYVAFRSKADNLDPADNPSFDATSCPSCTGVRDVFLHDRDPDADGTYDTGNGVTARVSVSSGGIPGDQGMGGPKLSGDGAFVAMVGPATNLVPGDTNFSEDVFLRDVSGMVTERVNVTSSGAQASTPILIPPDSDDTTMSSDGRFIAFRSLGVNLVVRDTNQFADIFLHDRDVDGDGVFGEIGAIETKRVSVSSDGMEGDLQSGGAKMSADGSLVAFYSDATNLVPNDTNLVRDVFVQGVATAGCVIDADCDDGDDCTSDVCGLGICAHPNAPTGTACGSSANSDCDNPDTCNGSGTCLANNESNGTPCGDASVTTCTGPDTCDGAGNCDPNDTPAGVSCGDAGDSACDHADSCDGSGNCAVNFEPAGSGCDDAIFCNGVDSCDGGGACLHAGPPCAVCACITAVDCSAGACVPCVDCIDAASDICEAETQCPCDPPIVAAVGSRYLTVTPLPVDSGQPMKIRVSSPEFPCLSKYVSGALRCGGTGDLCNDVSNCNQCSISGDACLQSEDCFNFPQGETCVISGLSCTPGPVEPFDINGDSISDGMLATLTDNPANAAVLTPAEWGATLNKCSLTYDDCASDTDCDHGICIHAGCGAQLCDTPCSVAAQNCNKFCDDPPGANCSSDTDCAVGGTCIMPVCERDETCIPGRVYITGPDIVPSTAVPGGGVLATSYDVVVDCGGETAPVSADMWVWCDVNKDGAVNFSDIQMAVFAFQGRFGFGNGVPNTLAASDLVGSIPCGPEQVTNFSDIGAQVFAFQGQDYLGRLNAGSCADASTCDVAAQGCSDASTCTRAHTCSVPCAP